MRLIPLLLAALLAACALPVRAVSLADVEVYDRTAGRTLPLYRHQGRLYVPGEPRHEYELRIRNRSGGRLLAVGSVDGVNVLSGQTASTDQGGYVLDGWGSVSIEGWRKSLQHVAAFYFTELPDSYAARTGRPDNVGVIGVALFRERAWCCRERGDDAQSRSEAPATAAAAPPAAEPGAAGSLSKSAPVDAERLGTGHGRIEDSLAYETSFQRNSDTPDEVISIWYDSRSRLLAQGVIPQPRRTAERAPEPFPAGFVPDP